MAPHSRRHRLFVILFFIVLIAFSLLVTTYLVLLRGQSTTSRPSTQQQQQQHPSPFPLPSKTATDPSKSPDKPIPYSGAVSKSSKGKDDSKPTVSSMPSSEDLDQSLPPLVTKNFVGNSAWTLMHAVAANVQFEPLVLMENRKRKTISDPLNPTTAPATPARTIPELTTTTTTTTVGQADENDVFREARNRMKFELKQLRERTTAEKFMILFELVGDLFPCSYCNRHFRSMMDEAEEDTMIAALWGEGVIDEAKRRQSSIGGGIGSGSGSDGNTAETVATIMNERASQWLCKVHNNVNKRVHHEEFVCKAETLLDRWHMSCDDGKCSAKP